MLSLSVRDLAWVWKGCSDSPRSPLANTHRDWIATIPSWPSHFRYRPMREVGLELSELLRDPKGPYRVDIIIALTHSRVPNVS